MTRTFRRLRMRARGILRGSSNGRRRTLPHNGTSHGARDINKLPSRNEGVPHSTCRLRELCSANTPGRIAAPDHAQRVPAHCLAR